MNDETKIQGKMTNGIASPTVFSEVIESKSQHINYVTDGKLITNIPQFSDGSGFHRVLNASTPFMPTAFANPDSLRKEAEKMPDNNDFMKYIDLLDKDRRDMESRIREDQKESEKRLLEHFKDQEEKYIQSVKSLNEKFDNLSSKFDDVKKENDDIPNKFNSQKKWLIGILLTCAGIGVAFAIGYTQILLQVLSLIPKK